MQYPDLLKRIKERPGLYLGEISIFTLKAFLDGYRHALEGDEGSNSLGDFQEYIVKHHTVSPVFSWDKIIRLYSSSDRQAFDRFFELFEQYLEEENANGLTEK